MTAFQYRFGLFEWLVTPLGLVNAPASFHRYINEHLREYLDINVTAYVDEILIYTDGNEESRWEIVCKVLYRLKSVGLFLDIDKCEFLSKTVKYLGFIIRAE